MTGESSGPHVAPDTLADYYAMSLAEDEAMRLEKHLMECQQCTEVARDVHRFSEALDSWTASSHGAAARSEARAASGIREILMRSIRAAQERVEDPLSRERLASWARRWEGQAVAAARVVMEGPGIASRILTESFDTLSGRGSSWQLMPASAATPIRGTLGTPGSSEALVALTPGAPPARIEVSGERGDIVVRLQLLPRGQTPPLVLLVDSRRDAPPRVEEPRQEPGLPYLLAHFKGVVPGDYLVAIEPGP
jgi:hypothetical protein